MQNCVQKFIKCVGGKYYWYIHASKQYSLNICKKLPKKAWYLLFDLCCPRMVKCFIGFEIARSNIDGMDFISRAIISKGCN